MVYYVEVELRLTVEQAIFQSLEGVLLIEGDFFSVLDLLMNERVQFRDDFFQRT